MCPKEPGYKNYADAHFNNIIEADAATCLKYGLKLYSGQLWDVGHWFEIGDQLDGRISGAAHDFKGTTNYMRQFISDEPWPNELGVMSYTTSNLNKLDPEHPTRAIIHPGTVEGHEKFMKWTYKKYVSYYCDNLCSNIIEYDDYPFLHGRTSDDFYENMEIIRENALKNNMYYWFCLQSQSSPAHRDPDEGELRFSVYSAVTYGFRGITYYCYTSQGVKGGIEVGLIGEDYVPNQKWQWAQRIYAGVTALAPRLARLKSVKVYHTKPLPLGTTGITGNDHVAGVTGGTMAIGEFKHEKSGMDYLAVMNSDCENLHVYKVKLNPRIQRISRINKNTGNYAPVQINDSSINVKLMPGDGNLYVIEPDDNPPTVSAILSAATVSDTQIGLTWEQSSDPESGIQYYQIYKNGQKYDTSEDAFYLDTHLPANTSYVYEVSAVNWELLESKKSCSVKASVGGSKTNAR